MKMVIAIVQDDDALDLIDTLTEKKVWSNKTCDNRWVLKVRKYNINDRCRERTCR